MPISMRGRQEEEEEGVVEELRVGQMGRWRGAEQRDVASCSTQKKKEGSLSEKEEQRAWRSRDAHLNVAHSKKSDEQDKNKCLSPGNATSSAAPVLLVCCIGFVRVI